jgi:hypothetical protein
MTPEVALLAFGALVSVSGTLLAWAITRLISTLIRLTTTLTLVEHRLEAHETKILALEAAVRLAAVTPPPH